MELVGHDFYLFSDVDTGRAERRLPPPRLRLRADPAQPADRLRCRRGCGLSGQSRVEQREADLVAERAVRVAQPRWPRRRRGSKPAAERGLLRGDVVDLRAEFEPGEAGLRRTPTATSSRSARVRVAAAAKGRVHAVADAADLRRPGRAAAASCRRSARSRRRRSRAAPTPADQPLAARPRARSRASSPRRRRLAVKPQPQRRPGRSRCSMHRVGVVAAPIGRSATTPSVSPPGGSGGNAGAIGSPGSVGQPGERAPVVGAPPRSVRGACRGAIALEGEARPRAPCAPRRGCATSQPDLDPVHARARTPSRPARRSPRRRSRARAPRARSSSRSSAWPSTVGGSRSAAEPTSRPVARLDDGAAEPGAVAAALVRRVRSTKSRASSRRVRIRQRRGTRASPGPA